jgi:hypothetical protein
VHALGAGVQTLSTVPFSRAGGFLKARCCGEKGASAQCSTGGWACWAQAMSVWHAFHEVPCVYDHADREVRTVVVSSAVATTREDHGDVTTMAAAAAGGRFALAGEGSGVGGGGRLFAWQRCTSQPSLLQLREAAAVAGAAETRLSLDFSSPVLHVAAAEAEGDTVGAAVHHSAAVEWFVLYILTADHALHLLTIHVPKAGCAALAAVTQADVATAVAHTRDEAMRHLGSPTALAGGPRTRGGGGGAGALLGGFNGSVL